MSLVFDFRRGLLNKDLNKGVSFMNLIKRTPLPISGLALGLAALGNLLRPFGENLRYAIGIVSGIIMIFYLLKLISDWKFVKHDAKSPVIHSILPSATMTFILLSTYIQPYFPVLALITWYVFSAIHMILMISFIIKYVKNFEISTVFSSLGLIACGLVVISVTSPAMNNVQLGQLAFWIGFSLYFLWLSLIFIRAFKMPVLLEPARPTIAITTAPMSLIIVGYFSVFTERSVILIYFMIFMAFSAYSFVIYKMFFLLRLRFYPSYSAFTFPLVISALAFRLSNNFLISNGINFFRPIYHISIFISIAIVIYVSVRYLIYMFAPAKAIFTPFKENELKDLIAKEIKPNIREIDENGLYMPKIIKKLGELGFYNSSNQNDTAVSLREAQLIEDIAKFCLTTAFNVWGQLTAINAVRCGTSDYLKKEILPKMESGELLGGPGLSTPMKSMVAFTDFTVTARKVKNGYILNGMVPQVSNHGSNHMFSIIAKIEGSTVKHTVFDDISKGADMISFLADASDESVEIKEQTGFIGMNGSATYSCYFNNTFISEDYILAQGLDVEDFIERCRASTVFNQVPLALGIISSSIDGIKNLSDTKKKVNKHLGISLKKLEHEYKDLKSQFIYYLSNVERPYEFKRLVMIRLEASYLSLKVANAMFLSQGGSAYLKNSNSERRLRETYFLCIITPSVAHLETILSL